MRHRIQLLFLLAVSSMFGQTWLETSRMKLGQAEYAREQLHVQGIPVWGEEAIRTDGERIETARARTKFPGKLDGLRFGSVNEAEAVATAKAQLGWPEGRVAYADRWWKPQADGSLAGVWRVILERHMGQVRRVLVDALSGQVVETFELTNRQARGNVFPRSPVSSRLQQAELASLSSANSLTGRAARVYSYLPVLLGLIPETSIGLPESQLARPDTGGNYFYSPDDPRFSEVQAYYGITRAADYIRSLGYSGLNRQFDVVVQYVDLESPYDVNAFFSPLLFSNRGGIVMQSNLLGADTTLDSSILFHEYGHATVHGIVGMLNSSKEFGAVNEAFSDYFAGSFLNTPAIGEYFPYLSPSPNFLTRQTYLRTMDNETFYPDFIQGEPHGDSLMFSGAMWDMRRALGQQRADLVAMNGLARMSAQMGFYSASQALIGAANSLYGNSVRDRVSQIFANRGLTSSTAQYSEQSIPLVSGETRVSMVDGKPAGVSYFLAPDDFRITVPRGVSGMRVQVEASGPVRPFVRFRAPVDIDGSSIVHDYFINDGRSLDGTVSLSSTPELQAGEYYFNVANTTATQVEYAIRITLTNDPAGAGASFPVISNGVPVTGSVPSNFLNTRQFRVVVPVGATALDLELSGDQDVDLYVNFGNPVQAGGEGLPLAEGISASAANTERMTLTTATVPNLRPGTYFVAVQNYSLAATAKFSLRATLRNDAVYAPSQDVVGPNDTRNLFLPVSSNTGILLTRQFRIDTQAAWRGLNLRVASNSNLLLLVKRNQPVRFANGVPDADARYLIQNEAKTVTLDTGSNPAFQQGSYYVAMLSLSERGGTVSFDYTAVGPSVSGPAIAAVVDGAGFTRQISPGSWITITGTSLAATTRIWGGTDFVGTALPTQLDGVSVTVGGLPAYVYFISPGQLNVLVPQSLRTGNLDVVVTTRAGRSAVFTVNCVAAVPALFRFDPQARRYAAAVFGNGAYAGPTGLFGSALATRPANRGEVVQLFATGLGSVGSTDGITNEAVVSITNRVTATLGGVNARVTFAGRVGAGQYQINLEVPASAGAGDQALRISISGVQSDAGVFLAVQ